MKFGNWQVNKDAIQFAGSPLQRFLVTTSDLLQTEESEEDGEMLYKTIIRATEEDWLTSDDLYDLNFALMYLAGSNNIAIDYEIFDRTLEYQFSLLDEEDDED